MNCQLISEIKKLISKLLQKQISKKIGNNTKSQFWRSRRSFRLPKNVKMATYQAELHRQSKQLLLLHPPVKFQPKPTFESKVMTPGSKSQSKPKSKSTTLTLRCPYISFSPPFHLAFIHFSCDILFTLQTFILLSLLSFLANNNLFYLVIDEAIP